MRQDLSALSVSPGGILFVSGFATSLRVERGALVVRTGSGRSVREGVFARVQRPRLRRLLVFGRGGFTTWHALEWLNAIGCTFVQMSMDGTVIVSSVFEHEEDTDPESA
jgi:hypothetical protein